MCERPNIISHYPGIPESQHFKQQELEESSEKSQRSYESFELGDSWECRDGSQIFPDDEESSGEGEGSQDTSNEVTINIEVQEEVEGESRNL